MPIPQKVRDVVRPYVRAWRFRRSIQQSLVWQHAHSDPADAETSTPPDGEQLEVPCVWVTEAYTPANVNGLVTALQKLGWDKPAQGFRDTGLIEQIQRPRSVSNHLSWTNGGVILRPGDTRFIGAEKRYGRLPRGVDYCALDLRSTASSLTLVTVQFVLTAEYADCLNEPLTASYRTTATYHPSGWRPISASYHGVAEQKAAAVQQRRDELHAELYIWLRRNLPGYFASQGGESYPTIDLLTSRDYVQSDNAPRRWDNYLSIVLGSGSHPWPCTNDESLELRLPSGDTDQTTALLFGNYQALVDGGGPHEAKGRAGLPLRLHRPVSGMASAWAMHHLLLSYEHGLARVRDRASSSALNVRRALADITYIHHQYLAISRDVQAVAADIAALAKSEQLWRLAFDALDFAPPQYLREHGSNFIETLRLQDEERAKQLDALEERVSKTVLASGDLATAAANMRVQRYVFWLTVVTAVLALVSVLSTLVPLLKPYVHW